MTTPDDWIGKKRLNVTAKWAEISDDTITLILQTFTMNVLLRLDPAELLLLER